MTDDPLRSPGYVAQRFGIAVTTVRYWVQMGFLNVGKRTAGNHMRFYDSEVERLWRAIDERNRGSINAATSGMPSGTTPSVVTKDAKVWTPAITSRQSAASPSSSSKASTTPLPGEAFLE